MAPPHTRKLQGVKHIKIYALHKHTDLGYNKIAESAGIAKSMWHCWTQQYMQWWHPQRISAWNAHKNLHYQKKIIDGIGDNKPCFGLRDIAGNENIGLGKMMVDKIIWEVGFKHLILRKKPY
jgi:hypothetical protein